MYVHNTYLNNNGTIHLREWKDNTHAISLFSCYRISMAFYLLKPCITLYFSFAFWQVQWLMELKDIPWSLVKLYILTELSCYSFYNYSLAELQVSFSSWLCHGKFQVSVAVFTLVGTFSSFYLQCCLRVRSTYSYFLSTVQGIEVFDYPVEQGAVLRGWRFCSPSARMSSEHGEVGRQKQLLSPIWF